MRIRRHVEYNIHRQYFSFIIIDIPNNIWLMKYAYGNST